MATILLGVDLGLVVGVICLLGTVVLRKYNAPVTVSGQLGQSPLYGDLNLFHNVSFNWSTAINNKVQNLI